MITGSQAFEGDTPVAVALKQIREYPKRPREIVPNLSHPIEAAILKCFQKDPAKRFQSVNELEVAFGESGGKPDRFRLAGFYRPGASSSGPEYAPGFA